MEPKDIIEQLNGMLFSGCSIEDGVLSLTFAPQTVGPEHTPSKVLSVTGVDGGDITIEDE